jgi:hypothetical protein
MYWYVQTYLPCQKTWCIMSKFTDIREAQASCEEFMILFPKKIWVISLQDLKGSVIS